MTCKRTFTLTLLSLVGLVACLVAGEYLIALIWLYFVVDNVFFTGCP